MTEIISKGYDGTYKLVHEASGEPVMAKEEFVYGAIEGGRAPHKPNSSGKVWPVGGGEYYPSVYNLKWVKIEEERGVKYPNIKVQLTGGNGNAFAILGAVHQALRRAKVPAEELTKFREEATSGDYDNLLATCMRWVDVG